MQQKFRLKSVLAVLVMMISACSLQPTIPPFQKQAFQPVPESSLYLPEPNVQRPQNGSQAALLKLSLELMEYIQDIKVSFNDLVEAVRERQRSPPGKE